MKPFWGTVGTQGFLPSGKGAVALAGGLLVIPILGSSLLAFEAINYHQVDFRLDRAVAINAVLGAKEGPGVAMDELDTIQKKLIRFNIKSVLASGEFEKIVTGSDAGGEATSLFEASATLPYEPIYSPLLEAAITDNAVTAGEAKVAARQTFKAERRRIKVEYALILDASASMRGDPLEDVRNGLRGFVNNLFGADATSPDVWISIVEFSTNVNVGARYADELITPDSQSIPRYRAGKRAGNRIASLVAKDEGYSNFLDPIKGPEAARGGACVARKSRGRDWLPMARGDGLSSEYAALLEDPPRSQRQGFDLLIGEGRAACEQHLVGRNKALCKKKNNRERKLTRGLGSRGGESELLYPDVINFMGLDQSVYTIQYPRNYGPDNIHPRLNRQGVDNKFLSEPIDYAVSAYPGCGQPMLVASSIKQELIRHINGYTGIYTTAADEGFAWGYRALHPNWRDVWHSAGDRIITGDAPADFDSEVQKKFIYFSDGFSNEGYFGNPLPRSRHSKASNIANFCRHIKGESASSPREGDDIEVTVVLLGDSDDFGSRQLDITKRNCPSAPEAKHYLQTSNSKQVESFLTHLGKQEYEARLVAR